MLVYGCLQWYNSLDSVLWLFYKKINGFCRDTGDSDPNCTVSGSPGPTYNNLIHLQHAGVVYFH